MRRYVFTALAGCGLFLTGLTASAQYRPRQDYGYQDQNGAAEVRLIRRVMRDIDHAQSLTSAGSADHWRLERARRELSQVDEQFGASGVSDRRDIDDAIITIQNVVESNDLNPRVRDSLVDDMNRLRELRGRMGY